MTDISVALENVTRSFGAKKVLRGVTVRLEKGKVAGILGRNGEGKTTLFKTMLDIIDADSGRIEINGLSPDGSGLLRQFTGYVPERPVFHNFMTVGDVFALRAGFFKNWNPARTGEIAKKLSLDLNCKIEGASKGTLGKIGWVCAVAHEPSVLLLDEPTSGLDALVRDELLSHMIEELQSSGKTILVANHRMEELAGVLDELWVLAGGVFAARYDMANLKTEARQITARLKAGVQLPAGTVLINQEGPLVEIAVFTKGEFDKAVGSGVLENINSAPLPVDTAMKMLLKITGENNG
ncbi:MAG: ABC transporter ATP-binding protein [Elusimicrobiaceae bacterium]